MVKLELDKDELESMGLHGEAIWVITYDFPSQRIDKDKDINKLLIDFRNKLGYIIKYKIQAYKIHESLWVITEDKLDLAKKQLEELKKNWATALSRYFNLDISQRVRIIPIVTTIDGYNSYEEQKVEFLLEFIEEHIAKGEKSLRAKAITPQKFYQLKKCFEMVQMLMQPLNYHPRYQEIVDSLMSLDDLIHQCDDMRRQNNNNH